MKFTLEDLKKLEPCEDGLFWYEGNIRSEIFEEVIVQLGNHHWPWAVWLFKALTEEQNKKIVIFCAKKVLPTFEASYPNDFRPRRAIEAAEKSEVTDAIVHDINRAVVETKCTLSTAYISVYAIAQTVVQPDTYVAAYSATRAANQVVAGFKQILLNYIGEILYELG
jgi:hypothetical protein